MRRLLSLLLIASTFQSSGCDSIQKKHDNPVMTAAPRRVERGASADSDTEVADNSPTQKNSKIREDDGSDIQLVNRELKKTNPWDGWEDDTAIFNSQVAATVNGAPILNGDVLDPHTLKLKHFREQMQEVAANPKRLQPGEPIPTPEDYQRLRYVAISNNINQYIQNKLLSEHLKSGLKAEQLKQMDSHIDDEFAKKIETLKKEFNVTNKTELELALNKNGTSLENVKKNFGIEMLAGECFHIKAEKPQPIDRPDLVAYYQAHIDDYAVSAKVKWEQIQVSFVSPSPADKDKAQKKLEEAIAELKRGSEFETVAKKYSDGPTAKDGGSRDWLEAGNLADTKLEKLLFSLPIGRLSKIHEGPSAFSVVRVTEKQSAGHKPFIEVQDEVKETLQKQQNIKRYMKFMKKLYTTAVIETQYALQAFPDE